MVLQLVVLILVILFPGTVTWLVEAGRGVAPVWNMTNAPAVPPLWGRQEMWNDEHESP
jgi:hypothetical protein